LNATKNLNLPQSWPLRVQDLDLKIFSEKLTQDKSSHKDLNELGKKNISSPEPVAIFPMLLLVTEKNPLLFETTKPQFGLSPLRHLGYAFQWFTMAIAVIIYYTVINIRRKSYATNKTIRPSQDF